MNVAEKRALIARYRYSLDDLESKLKGLDEATVDFVPPVEGAWSIRTHVAHFLDAEVHAWTRIRRTVAEPESAVVLWDEEAWAERSHYSRVDYKRALDLTRNLRDSLADFLEGIVEEDWNRYAVIHPTRGRQELDTIVKIYADHASFHIPYIERNLAAYRNRKA